MTSHEEMVSMAKAIGEKYAKKDHRKNSAAIEGYGDEMGFRIGIRNNFEIYHPDPEVPDITMNHYEAQKIAHWIIEQFAEINKD